MIRTKKVPDLYDHIVVPARRQFDGAGRFEGIKFGKKNWVMMTELNDAVTATLVRQGCEQKAQYETFDFRLLQPQLRFPYINRDPNTNAAARLVVADSPHECAFKDRSLYVLHAWASRVLKLVHGGVIALKTNKGYPSKVSGVHWKKGDVDEGELTMILFKSEISD